MLPMRSQKSYYNHKSNLNKVSLKKMFPSENGIIYKIMFYSAKDLNVEVLHIL